MSVTLGYISFDIYKRDSLQTGKKSRLHNGKKERVFKIAGQRLPINVTNADQQGRTFIKTNIGKDF